MNNESISGLADLFIALSDRTRLRLLGLIGDGQVSVGYLADSLGESQPKVSRHLAYLRGAGLVSTQRDGKWIYYGIEPPADPAQRAVLFETLRMLGAEIGRTQAAIPSGSKAYEIDAADRSEWFPNEIEIYLL